MNGFTPSEWKMIMDVLHMVAPLLVLVAVFVVIVWRSTNKR